MFRKKPIPEHVEFNAPFYDPNQRDPRCKRLPGRANHLRVYEYKNRVFVIDPVADTVATVSRVHAAPYMLKSTDHKNSRIAGWGKALATLSSERGVIAQLQHIERTVPELGKGLEAYTEARMQETTTPQTVAYQELVANAGRGAQSHESFFALTFRKSALVNSRRERKVSLETLLDTAIQASTPFAQACANGAITIEPIRTIGELGTIIQTAYDPNSALTLASTSTPAELFGPRTGVEDYDVYYTDSSVHAVWRVWQWPQGNETSAEFLWGMLFPEVHLPFTRALSIIDRPLRAKESKRASQEERTQIQNSRRLRDKLGKATTTGDARPLTDLEERERDLDRGHREVSREALITITARNVAELDELVTTIESAAATCNLELARVYGNVAEMFVPATLPLGLVVVK